MGINVCAPQVLRAAMPTHHGCTRRAVPVHRGCYGEQCLCRGTTMLVPGSLLFSFLLISLSTKLMM